MVPVLAWYLSFFKPCIVDSNSLDLTPKTFNREGGTKLEGEPDYKDADIIVDFIAKRQQSLWMTRDDEMKELDSIAGNRSNDNNK